MLQPRCYGSLLHPTLCCDLLLLSVDACCCNKLLRCCYPLLDSEALIATPTAIITLTVSCYPCSGCSACIVAGYSLPCSWAASGALWPCQWVVTNSGLPRSWAAIGHNLPWLRGETYVGHDCCCLLNSSSLFFSKP